MGVCSLWTDVGAAVVLVRVGSRGQQHRCWNADLAQIQKVVGISKKGAVQNR